MTLFLKYLGYLIKVIFNFTWLTILTQVGGVIYLIFKPFAALYLYKKPIKTKWKQRLFRFGGFTIFYIIVSLTIIPPLAQNWGKSPLPWFSSNNTPLAARSFIFPLLNRHYVKTELKDIAVNHARNLHEKHPGSKLLYLDGNFPLFERFLMFPHLSHYDGRKLDLCFLYEKKGSKQLVNTTPWFWGYGACEIAKKGESNQTEKCNNREYWQYGLLYNFTPQWFQSWYAFDENRNKYLLTEMAKDERIDKIFIEPHLSKRLKVKRFSKIRFHGCKSVRHDDHIHIQI